MENKTTGAIIGALARNDGGCPSVIIARSVGRLDECVSSCLDVRSCPTCKDEWFGHLIDMIEREKAAAASAAMERTMAEHMREWAEDNGLPAFHDGESFKAWIDRCFLPRPLYESGEPVQFGDRYVQHATNRLDTVSSITYSQGDGLYVRINGGGRCDASQRYRRELPVLDADGVPIKVGDIVYLADDDGSVEFMVEGLPKPDAYQAVQVFSGNLHTSYDPPRLTHKRPDTQESIEMDALLPAIQYWRCEGSPCSECPARVDGKTPAERYGTPDDCDLAMVLDLLRRQRELDARKGGAE